jgi:hypothetical protein
VISVLGSQRVLIAAFLAQNMNADPQKNGAL